MRGISFRNIIMALIIAILCLVSLVGAQYSRFGYSEEEAKLYRMPIKQITPKDGIWTGHVIAYGHYIRPPYKIELKDTIVFINNVQVYPALKTPGMIAKEKREQELGEARKKAMREYIEIHQDEYTEMQRIDSLAKVLYEKEKASRGKEYAIDAVIEYYRKSSGVDSTRVISADDGEFLVFYAAGTIQYELRRMRGFKRPSKKTIRYAPTPVSTSGPPIYKTKEERDADMQKMGFPTTKQGWAELWAKRYEKLLRDGWVQVFGVDGKDNTTESKLLEVFKIIDDNKTSKCEKYNNLRGILPHMQSLAIIENYHSKEWKSIRRQQ